ncbi:hypothetical protein BDZ94DRAFT_1314708 [Collybia nuda]|uniref:Ubinuclein middle domain-containing protein n=1 Tax=Collybia nuda TaxID=64659 RepID=A0A9P6CDB8_9AGAR|nr:hypothetical protein BDZ94DRAFT_1314708 [Collybia nuda]
MAESDIEMLSGDGEERVISEFDNPPQSPSVSATSSRHTPQPDNNINNSNTIHIVDDDEPQPVLPIAAGDNGDDDGNNNNKPPSVTASGHKPSSKPPSSKPPSSKPRSSKPHKPRSPSPTPPPPPPPAPPLQTIRLEIKLGGPNNYAVDIAEISRSTGQRAPTPTRAPAGHVSDSEDEDEEEKGAKKEKGKRRKKNPASEYYDVSDPFIDDSELAIDERTFFAQTKQQGFYVSSGEVALLKDKTPKKPKSKNLLHGGISAATHPAVTASKKLAAVKKETSQDSPAAGPSASGSEEENKAGGHSEVGEDERAGQKRKRYITVMDGGKKRKVVDVHSFHPDLQAAIEKIKVAIANESWDQKGKFPPSLKPLLSQLAILAIKLDEYDEYFFNLMPSLFPYNKFTMSKLIKRTVFNDHTELLMQRQEVLLTELARLAKEGFAKAEEEWEKSVVAWDKRQEKLRAEAASGIDSTVGTGTDSAGPTRHPTEEMDVDQQPQSASAVVQDKDGKDGKDGAHGQHPPAKKFRMTEAMKGIVWQLVLLSNECCRLENEKNSLEGSVLQVSEQGLRKVLYQKIVAAFPEGWMSSGQISRDVSSMKKKYEKEAMENEA